MTGAAVRPPATTARFGRAVVASAPLRISLAGGGTDLPSYADRFGGAVVGTTTDRRVCVIRYPGLFGGGVRTAFGEPEEVAEASQLRNPYARACLLRAGSPRDLQIGCYSDAPAGSGLGGSGAFTVALTAALRHPEAPGPAELAEQASAVEMVDLRRPVGKQDHYLAAFGGPCLLRIARDRSVEVERLRPHPAVARYLDERLMLFRLGGTRDAGHALAAQARGALNADPAVLRSLHGIKDLVEPAVAALRHGRVDEIGPILDAHWALKAALSPTTADDSVRDLYALARDSGADGGKVLGAGGGGFLLLSSARGRQQDVRAAMTARGLPELPFGTDGAGVYVGPVATTPGTPGP
ncbi:D-glycero-alpha-D-manno-heptose-7-phosphate kinase [Streptomyces sp. Ag109_O5-1]|uniref:GHMP family kinase ATP-binding protein n=1 Tax=Streptomyces sp. Ag109_O5-1 TaxID=1938851 RepID=UPI000F50D0FE|nr:hypothetical protein [Streptomyces sp. Ag109_O5-1]RPE39968.1 D-glycero-alpha-D-manno-heptose-7-phosphate kinase [Streptomyces sp. Ag109_O5-1]